MNIKLQVIIEATVIFVLVALFNYLYFIRKMKKLNKNDMPLELIYLCEIYSIDPQKINFKHFQFTYCFLNAFIITTTYMLVVYLIKLMILKVILGIVILVLLIIICYGLLGRYYLYKERKLDKKLKK